MMKYNMLTLMEI